MTEDDARGLQRMRSVQQGSAQHVEEHVAEKVEDAADRCDHKLLDHLVTTRLEDLPHPADVVADQDHNNVDEAEAYGEGNAKGLEPRVEERVVERKVAHRVEQRHEVGEQDGEEGDDLCGHGSAPV